MYRKLELLECVLTKQKNGSIIAKAIVGFLFPDPPILNMDEFPYDPQSDKYYSNFIEHINYV